MLSPIKIVIADDHALIRIGIIDYLRKESRIEVIAEAANGLILLDILAKTDPLPHLVIVDLKMPLLSGEDATSQILMLYPTVKILILSVDTEKNTVINLFEKGIHGYLCKDDADKQLIDAIYEIIDNGVYKNEYFEWQLVQKEYSANKKCIKSTLSFNELQFLIYCAKGLKYKEIAKNLNKSEKTIENYRDGVYKKLNINNQKQLVQFAIQEKLV